MCPHNVTGEESTIAVTKSISPSVIEKYFRINSDESKIDFNISGFGSKGGIIPRDIVFSIDFSGSMRSSDPHNERLFATKSFIDKLDPSVDRAGVVFWHTDIARVEPKTTKEMLNLTLTKPAKWGLTTNYTLLKEEALNNETTWHHGGTNLDLGLKTAIEMLDANATADSTDTSSKVIVFLTDGEGQYIPAGTKGSQADIAMEKGYRVFSIGLNLINGSLAEEKLMNMSTATGGMYFNSSSPENLQSIFSSIEQKLRSKTIPSSVDLTETMQPYVLVNRSSFSISPSSITSNELGQTVVKWQNISQYIGNRDGELSSNEFFQVNFSISSSKAGQRLPLDVQEESFLALESNKTKHSITMPQVYFDAVKLQTNSALSLENDVYTNLSSSYRQDNASISSMLYPSDFIKRTLQPKTINIISGEISKQQCYPSGHIGTNDHNSSDQATMNLNVVGGGGSESFATPIDIVFAIDSSASMKHNDPNNKRIEAAKMFSDKLDLSRDKVGIASWDNDIDFTFGLSSDLLTVKTNLDMIDHRGGTDLNVGLDSAISLLDGNSRNEPSSKAIIFLSDGQENYTPSGSPGSPADNAKSKGYKIFSIGLNIEPGSIEETNLKDIAVATGARYYFPPTAENLQAAFDNIFEQVIILTAPKNIDVTEVLQNYVTVNQSSLSIKPTSISVSEGGNTEIVWNNAAQRVGNKDTELGENESFSVNFAIGISNIGMSNITLPVDVEGASKIDYVDPHGGKHLLSISPSTYINVLSRLCE